MKVQPSYKRDLKELQDLFYSVRLQERQQQVLDLPASRPRISVSNLPSLRILLQLGGHIQLQSVTGNKHKPGINWKGGILLCLLLGYSTDTCNLRRGLSWHTVQSKAGQPLAEPGGGEQLMARCGAERERGARKPD